MDTWLPFHLVWCLPGRYMQQEAEVPTCSGSSFLHPWLLTGRLVLFGVGFSWSQGTVSTITLNAAFPKGQDGLGQRGNPQLPASWVFKKDPFLSDTRNRKGAGSAHGCVFVPCYYV